MKRLTFAILVLTTIIFNGALSAQNLISSTYKGTKTKAQLVSLFGNPIIQYGAKYYKVTYTSPDPQGILDTLSGLIAVPDDASKVFPKLVYQHGTSDCKACVPSNYGTTGGAEGQLGLLFAGMGYVALLPDYVGMGEGRGFQTYVHAATEASAAVDMIRASGTWATDNAVATNEQLFITGYSQGGHAAMALHRAIETELSDEMTVTAAAHLSGPYSISGVMRDLILSETEYYYPAYIPNTALGFQTAYGNLFNDLSDMFKPEYVPAIQQYYDGAISLSSLNSTLIQNLITNTGASVASRMIRDEVLLEIANNPDHPINLALQDNDVYDWTPVSPTRIFYCMADDQVPFMNSVIASETMTANGAPSFASADVNSNADHSGCFSPAMTQTLFFFLSLQQVTVGTQEPLAAFSVSAAPNPVTETLYLRGLPATASLQLTDSNGRVAFSKTSVATGTEEIDVRAFPAGMYQVQVVLTDGRVGVQQVVIMK